MNEVWKDIEGWENLYQISSFGRVRSLTRKVVRRNNHKEAVWTYRGKLLKPLFSGWGYVCFYLLKDGKRKQIYVHQEVAKHFIDNSRNLKIVNHKDGIKTNNNIINLEWVTKSEDLTHAYRTNLR